MLRVTAVAKLNAMFMDVFLADRAGLGRIRGCGCDQSILNLLGIGDDRNCLFPIGRNMKGHLNRRLARRLRRLSQVLQKFLHRLPHLDLVIRHPQSISTIGMPEEHTEKSFIPSGKFAEGVHVLH